MPSCMLAGPGPKYSMPRLTGYMKHDPTRKIEPAYTIRQRTFIDMHNNVPGPNKYAVYNITNHGKSFAPAYTLGVKRMDTIHDPGPSPANYMVEKVVFVNHHKRAPAYTIRTRLKENVGSLSPGPNVLIPTTIGPKVPHKKAMPCYTMSFFKPKHIIDNNPGPAAYANNHLNIAKPRHPAYSIRFPTSEQKANDVPGPKYNSVNLGKRAPTFAFGIKHSECTVLPMTPNDEF